MNCTAQNIRNDLDLEFAFKVKQIDEFIERFNFGTTRQNILKMYLDKNIHHNKDTFKRVFFIKTLFNQEDNLDVSLAKEFISFVDSLAHPTYLNFYDNDWYVLLSCDFFYKDKTKKVELILRNQVKKEKISKWVIFSIKSDLFNRPLAIDSTKILTPMSHAVDFMSLGKAFEDKKNSANYYRNDFKPDALSEFSYLIQENLLIFKKINSIDYYFLQIPNWFFRVEYFNRQTNNSGWLISQLKKMNVEEKIRFKKDVLNIN